MPGLKNVKALALKGNKLGDEGERILAESETFKHNEKLSLWGNDISAHGARMKYRARISTDPTDRTGATAGSTASALPLNEHGHDHVNVVLRVRWAKHTRA